MIRTNLNFQGKWRTYQQRVLDHSSQYLKDGKIHIVASPGSGKTTLGIELIARINKPVLILVPSITIREQWKDRIVDAFLVNKELESSLISQNLKDIKPITITTYQSIHACMSKFKGMDEEQEEVDYSNFDLFHALYTVGTSVLCLDECHHLKSEWWKSLEEFKNKLGNVETISLTATPPYDSGLQQWNRYISMCGDIDEEISIPELVKEGSLCAHQDYIYFNYPTKEETKVVEAFNQKSKEVALAFLHDEQFEKVILGHKVFHQQMFPSELLEDPSYLSSLLIYLQAKNYQIPVYLQELIGSQHLPKINLHWMEVLLQNVLYNAIEDFEYPGEWKEVWIDYLKSKGCIEKNQVQLCLNTNVEKLLIHSMGKLNSIVSIAQSEWDALGKDLRLLVLTDYIRKEQEKNLGTENFVPSLGVLPFFETLRKHFENQDVKIAVLCGGLVILPESAVDDMLAYINEPVSLEKVGKISEDQYVKVSVKGDFHAMASIMSTLFSQGAFHILIGTKSLLGEGWDSPCVNSLILASFVGSFMLSNQMRGRAIRVFKENPNKTSNIWHLVCIKPNSILKKEKQEHADLEVVESEDWLIVEKRMKHFLGLHYSEDIICDGIERFSCIQKPFTKENVEASNQKMLELSKQRDSLKERWNTALDVSSKFEIVQENEVHTKAIPKANIAEKSMVALGSLVCSIGLFALFKTLDFEAFRLLSISSGLVGGLFLPNIYAYSSPVKRLKKMGEGLISAMKEANLLQENEYACIVHSSGEHQSIYLQGGSEREKEMFAKNVSEIFAPINNQRYLLKNRNHYYCVPESFATNKELANLFYSHLKKVMGKMDIIYTRSGKGREELLKARAYSYAKQNNPLSSKKKVKSRYE
ncbi:MAG: DEAD/DEAH box helicase family protein [Firmicutes bacterium]|nr:DEAD/DEAH box helicase family protein [Bacillota bacterium]